MSAPDFLPFTKPAIDDATIQGVVEVLRSGWITSGPQVKAFEARLSAHCGGRPVRAFNSGTCTMEIALRVAGIGPGHEVITTPLSWVATSNVILAVGARPVFVDVEPASFNLDTAQLEAVLARHPSVKAILPVHILGYPARIPEICEVAKAHGIPVIEDASHAPGASVNGKMVGTFGVMGVFSLQQRKTISTGDGGVICTDDDMLADKLWRLRSFGDKELSYNYRMTEFAGVLGQIGLRKLGPHNEERAWAAHYLTKGFDGHPKIRIRRPREHEVGVYYAVAIELDITDEESTTIMAYLEQRGYPMRKAFPPLNRHPHFNPDTTPARGLPWEHPSYTGTMRGISYKDLHLPEIGRAHV